VKPHLGTIKGQISDHNGHKIIWGKFVDHPHFAGRFGHTSYIVKHNEATGEVETRNSRYTLLPDGS
jgi:hypothetical protein